MSDKEDITKVMKFYTENRSTCSYCGAKAMITRGDYSICYYCGNRIYKNDKTRFKGELGKAMKKRFL